MLLGPSRSASAFRRWHRPRPPRPASPARQPSQSNPDAAALLDILDPPLRSGRGARPARHRAGVGRPARDSLPQVQMPARSAGSSGWDGRTAWSQDYSGLVTIDGGTDGPPAEHRPGLSRQSRAICGQRRRRDRRLRRETHRRRQELRRTRGHATLRQRGRPLDRSADALDRARNRNHRHQQLYHHALRLPARRRHHVSLPQQHRHLERQLVGDEV